MISRKNCEGYSDPTTYSALCDIDAEERFHKLLKVIFALCEIAGFSLEGRITLRDNKTGKVWR